MNQPSTLTPLEAVNEIHKDKGQVVLVLQGGGALGAYQGGVYHALHEAGIEPDWIVGTSIGAINASIVAGNRPEDRLARSSISVMGMEIRSSTLSRSTIPPLRRARRSSTRARSRPR